MAAVPISRDIAFILVLLADDQQLGHNIQLKFHNKITCRLVPVEVGFDNLLVIDVSFLPRLALA